MNNGKTRNKTTTSSYFYLFAHTPTFGLSFLSCMFWFRLIRFHIAFTHSLSFLRIIIRCCCCFCFSCLHFYVNAKAFSLFHEHHQCCRAKRKVKKKKKSTLKKNAHNTVYVVVLLFGCIYINFLLLL